MTKLSKILPTLFEWSQEFKEDTINIKVLMRKNMRMN